MEKEKIELYLSEDILQGEEVPFYILLERDDIASISLEFQGFSSIKQYHNVVSHFSTKKRQITIEDLKTPNYLGGVLKSIVSEKPYEKAFLKIIVNLKNQKKIELNEKRILYNTTLNIKNLPKSLKIERYLQKPPIEIELNGNTTIFIEINNTKDSKVKVVLPDEILDAIDKFYTTLNRGLLELKKEFPEYNSFFDSFLKVSNKTTEQQFIDKVSKEFEKIKPNRNFLEAFGIVVFNCMIETASFKERIFTPILEYISSTASEKAFLEAPFALINIPRGGGLLKLKISDYNILEKFETFPEIKEKKPILIETKVESKNDLLIPIREFIKIRRN